MKIPFYLQCDACHKEKYSWANANAVNVNHHCDCGKERKFSLSSDITLGYKILYRSSYEFNENKDYSLSVVFSATAFDCEMSRLHRKWQDLNMSKAGKRLVEKELDEALRQCRTVSKKIEKTDLPPESVQSRGRVSGYLGYCFYPAIV